MPDRPPPPGFITVLNDIDRRLRDTERQLVFPDDTDTDLQVFENGNQLGPVQFLDFGSNLQATLIGDRYVRVDAPASAPEFDAIVDGNAGVTSEDARLFLGIGEACAYLDSLGMESVNILVRNKGDYNSAGLESYVETANFNSPGAVHLFGLRGGQDDLVDAAREAGISWKMDGFRPIQTLFSVGAHFYIHDFAEFELGNQAAQPFGLLYMENTRCDWVSRTGAAATRIVARDCNFDLVSAQTLVTEMGYYENCDMAFRSLSGAGGTLTFGGSSCYFQGALLCGSSSGTHAITLPQYFDLIVRMNNFNRSGLTVLGSFNVTVPADAQGRFWAMQGGRFNISAPSTTSILDLRGMGFGTVNVASCEKLIMDVSCGDLTVGASPAGNPIPLVRALVEGNLDLSHTQVDIVLAGAGRSVTLRSTVSGHINCRGLTKSSGTLLNYVSGAVFGHLTVTYNEANASGTAVPYAFAAGADDNLLIMMGTTDWPAAGTRTGLRNRVWPEDLTTLNGHVIEDEGAPLAQRANMNFVGTIVAVTDSAPDTLVTITDPVPAHAAAADPHTGYQKESEKDAASGYVGLDASENATIDGILTVGDKVFPGTDAGATQAVAGLYGGTGAPNNANGNNGDFFFNAAGGALTTIYQKRLGIWVGVV